ncbi:MAG: hypothetical protein ACKVS6_11730 [Planctomycetota bacterium]
MSGAALAQESEPANALHLSLEEAVDRASPAERKKAADALASRNETLENWCAAAKSFGSYQKIEPGVRRDNVQLWTGKASQEYSIITYVPSAYDPSKPTPLLLALHGTAGSGNEMVEMWRSSAERGGFIVVANTEPLAKEGYTFKSEERLAAMYTIRWARRIFNINENKIFGTGISRGGHLLWDTALRNPDLYAGIFPMIGGPWAVPSGGRANLRYLPSILHLPIRDLQGSKDDPGLVALLHYAFKKLKDLKAADAELIEFPELGHWFKFDAVDWVEFINSRSRNPRPGQVIVTSVGKHDSASSFWGEILTVGKEVQEEFVTKLNPAEAAKVNAMDARTRSEWWDQQAAKHTAKLELKMVAPGEFSAKGTGVVKFRLLLTEGMFDPKKPVVVNFNGKSKNYAVKPDKKILLQNFVDRFDRTILPIAEIRVE